MRVSGNCPYCNARYTWEWEDIRRGKLENVSCEMCRRDIYNDIKSRMEEIKRLKAERANLYGAFTPYDLSIDEKLDAIMEEVKAIHKLTKKAIGEEA